MKPGLLIVVSGPAGVGKGSVVKRVRELNGEIVMSVSATSRKPRPGEAEGVSYFFKTRGQFEEMIRDDRLVEWVEYCGNYYGTPKQFVAQELEKGNDVILEIEVQGSMRIKKLFPGSVMVFIAPPSFAELMRRLRDRKTEDEASIQNRLAKAREEFGYIDEYDYVIINDTIEEAAKEFASVLRSEKLRTARNRKLIDDLLKKE